MNQENKLDFGSVQVHKKVIAELICSSINDIDGMRLVKKTISDRILGLLGQSKFPGITINVNGDGEISIEVKVFVRYGINIPSVAKQAQEMIKESIDKTMDTHLKDININVQGVEKEES